MADDAEANPNIGLMENAFLRLTQQPWEELTVIRSPCYLLVPLCPYT